MTYPVMVSQVQGLMWFWTHDPAVPAAIRAKHAARGLCRDEWPDNGHFPTQLYVREAARMVGDTVFTYPKRQAQHAAGPAAAAGCLHDSVAVSRRPIFETVLAVSVANVEIEGSRRLHLVVQIQSWGVDIHEMQRVAIVASDPMVFNEGLTAPGTGGNYLSEIPYYVVSHGVTSTPSLA